MWQSAALLDTQEHPASARKVRVMAVARLICSLLLAVGLSAYGGPLDGTILKLHSDDIAVVRQHLTVNDLAAGRSFIPRSNLYRISKLPGANGVDASAA